MSECGGQLARFGREAMKCTCEIVIAGQPHEYARQAADAAFDVLEQIDRALNRFREDSDVAQINALPAGAWVRVGPAAWDCLTLAIRLHRRTGGAFDVTLGSGIGQLVLAEAEHAIGVRADGVQVDLGGIGKGYAVDRMAEVLADWSIGAALVHAGQSAVLAVGAPPGEQGWTVPLRDPTAPAERIGQLALRDGALAGSGVRLHGAHIVDPRKGGPADPSRLAAWAAAPTAAEADALSTALMVMGEDEARRFCERHRQVRGLLVCRAAGGRRIVRLGDWPADCLAGPG
jgi:thiamine biosynthesis lipoprotein